AHVPSQQELDLLFGPMYDKFFNAGSSSKDTQPTMNIQPTSTPSTPTYVHAEENNVNQAKEEHLPDDEFTNPFCAPAQEVAESSSHNIAMADSAWIEAMREELHQFDRLQAKYALETLHKHGMEKVKELDCSAISSAEAEYVALSASCAQVMWMRIQLQDYGFNYNKIPFKYLIRRIGMRCLTLVELEVLAKESA
nr:copia protein [Tanacetum cinerariifolium]